MVKKCNCRNGSMQTCRMQVATFSEVTSRLREKYKQAEKLSYEVVTVSVSLGNSVKELANEKAIPAKQSSLVYLVPFPDYCISNVTESSVGMKGRKCFRNTSPFEDNSCRNLCTDCGYNVKNIKRQETTNCMPCPFVWCCQVKCDKCVGDVEEYFCD